MASPTGLLSLPPEIIRVICRELILYRPGYDENHGLKQLSLFSRTCKHVNQAATPLLYSRFLATPSILVTMRFLSSLCRRPELGEFVQQLGFNFPSTEIKVIEHLDIYSEAAARLGVHLGDWSSHNPYETLIHLIIGHTPNVRSMQIFTDRFIEPMANIPTVLDQLAAQGPKRISFPRLERLLIKHCYVTGLPIEHYATLLALAPCLRHLWLEPSPPLHHPWTQPSGRLSLASVTRLTLRLGSLTKNQLETVVHSCGPLELFQHRQSMYSFERRPSVTPAEMIRILEPHAGTLRALSLDLAWRNRDNPAAFYAGPLCMEGDQIRSLKAFSRLEDLELDGSCFVFPAKDDFYYHAYVFAQMLPETIRRFRIIVAPPGTVENLRTLLKSRSQFPRLAQICMENRMLCPELDHNVFFRERDLTDLTVKMKLAGIRFGHDCPLIVDSPSPDFEFTTYAIWPNQNPSSPKETVPLPQFGQRLPGQSDGDAFDLDGLWGW
ncbi:hypothetical protein BBK36DRAFT_1122614 [Trichoderma citrinoviride]|uniref:F-box domain-containing protein n=1 Tax=Trichoderma citrinoviride TaxID=58853 RepID=A0A2T4B781_9HYPO|nr:hypothetical protein BBK36DRAFT_1122614 [Trichoderma citrinoviride]PTB65071.1 hypothetical protein BBK36DRAFT_1122614 [Trichoderma citrinoviride]